MDEHDAIKITRELKAALALAGVRQIDIARANDIKLSEVCAVVQNRRSTPRTRAAIAEAIDKAVAEIWPDTKRQA